MPEKTSVIYTDRRINRQEMSKKEQIVDEYNENNYIHVNGNGLRFHVSSVTFFCGWIFVYRSVKLKLIRVFF